MAYRTRLTDNGCSALGQNVRQQNWARLAFLLWFLLLQPVVHVALSAEFINIDDQPTSLLKLPTYYRIDDDIDLVSTPSTSSPRPGTSVKSVVPQLISDSMEESTSVFNQLVGTLVEEETGKFLDQVDAVQLAKPDGKKGGQHRLYTDYDASVLSSPSGHLISVRFTIQGTISGSKGPYLVHRVLNYDLANGQQIELSDVFEEGANYLELLSQYTNSMLAKTLTAPDINKIAEGTSPDPGNFKNWNMKSNGLIITFEKGQVASEVYGSQTVLVPYAAVKDMVPPGSLLSYCVRHRRQCLHGNLLTGGFIDEAINTFHRIFNPIFG